METKEYILICSCGGQEKKAVNAFQVLSPNKPTPQVVKGRDAIYKLGKAINNPHIQAIGKLSGRFAYYVKLENGIIVEEYELTKGRRIA